MLHYYTRTHKYWIRSDTLRSEYLSFPDSLRFVAGDLERSKGVTSSSLNSNHACLLKHLVQSEVSFAARSEYTRYIENLSFIMPMISTRAFVE
jgi:hypothetical protein